MKVNLGHDSSGRPLVVDDRTLAKLRFAEAVLGFKFTIVQGSYMKDHRTEASGPTHDEGGVIDLRSWNLPAHISTWDAQVALRRAGLVAWYRTKAQGFDPHFHCVDRGNPDLDPSAARQVTSWERGRNGLANNRADDGPPVSIPTDPPKQQEDDMPAPKDWDKEDWAAFSSHVSKAVFSTAVIKWGQDIINLPTALVRLSLGRKP